MAEKTWEEEYKPQFVRLLPNTAMAAATGQPVAEVDLLGRTLKIRCATILDAEGVRGVDVNAVKQAVAIAVLALDQNDPAPTAEELRKLRLYEARKLSEVVTCFLWEGELSRA